MLISPKNKMASNRRRRKNYLHLIASKVKRCANVFRDKAWNAWHAKLKGSCYLMDDDDERRKVFK